MTVARLTTRIKAALPWVQRAFLALAIGAIGAYLALHWRQLRQAFTPELVPHSLLAISAFVVCHFAIIAFCYGVQRAVGVERSFARTLSSYLRRLPARYIPGGIWHSAARYLDIRIEQDLPAQRLARLFLLEIGVAAASGFVVGGGGAMSMHAWVARFQPYAVVMLGCGLLALLVLAVLVARGGGKVRWLALAGTAMAVTWVIAGLGFAQLALSVFGMPGQCNVEDVAATQVAAASLGYVAIFAPQGWGVTEATFAVLTTCMVALPQVLLAFVLFRMCSLVADLAAFAGGFIGERWIRYLQDRRLNGA